MAVDFASEVTSTDGSRYTPFRITVIEGDRDPLELHIRPNEGSETYFLFGKPLSAARLRSTKVAKLLIHGDPSDSSAYLQFDLDGSEASHPYSFAVEGKTISLYPDAWSGSIPPIVDMTADIESEVKRNFNAEGDSQIVTISNFSSSGQAAESELPEFEALRIVAPIKSTVLITALQSDSADTFRGVYFATDDKLSTKEVRGFVRQGVLDKWYSPKDQ